MNDLAREKLVEAAINGQKQIVGSFSKGNGLCALGVLGYHYGMSYLQARELDRQYDLSNPYSRCPFIGTEEEKESSEYMPGCKTFSKMEYHQRQLVAHFNDVHELSFLDIARKFPEDQHGVDSK